MPNRLFLPAAVLAASLVLLPARQAHASGAPTTEQALMLAALVVVTPTQVIGLGSTAYYAATGPRPEHVAWAVYNTLAGGAGLASAFLYFRGGYPQFGAPFLLAGGIELGYAAYSFLAPAEKRSVAISVAPGGLALRGEF